MASSSSPKEATIQSHGAIGAEAQSSPRYSEQSSSVGVNVGDNPDAANPDSNEATQTDSVDALMEKGSTAFQDRAFAKAAKAFEDVLHILIKDNAEFDAEFVPAYFKFGLALQAPIQIESDLMTEAVPMEADYLLHSNGDGSTIVAKPVDSPSHNERGPCDGIMNKGSTEDLESARVALHEAWSIVEKLSDDSTEKVDILSAIGEVALKEGIWDSSCKHYQEALSILERLVDQENPRIAHLITEAIEYCQQAILVCKNRIQRLTDESKSSSGLANVNQEPSSSSSSSSVPDVGPTLLNKDEVAMLELLSREFENKLPILQQQFQSSPPPTPGFDSLNTINPEITSPDGTQVSASNQPGFCEFESPTASKDPASNEESSTETSTGEDNQDYSTSMSAASNQPGGFEYTPPTASTARTNERESDRAAWKGSKRRLLFTDPSSNESTPTKKPSLDPSAEEGKEGTP